MRQYLSAIRTPLSISLAVTVLAGITGSLIFILPVILLLLLDILGRTQDFLWLKKIEESKKVKGYWELFSNTRCSRDVMMAIDPESKEYYKLCGYRWYHILPDDLFCDKYPFVNWKLFFNLSRPRIRLKR